jgi:hypothetical protein
MNIQTVNLFYGGYDYLVIGCGYIERLEHKLDKILKPIREEDGTHNIAFFGYFSDKKITYVENFNPNVRQPILKEVADACLEVTNKGIYMEDSVCIKVDDDVDDILKVLFAQRHCGFFCRDGRYEVISFETASGKKVLYEHYDTESG